MTAIGIISELSYLKKHSYYFYQINTPEMFLLVLKHSLKVKNLVIEVKPYYKVSTTLKHQERVEFCEESSF